MTDSAAPTHEAVQVVNYLPADSFAEHDDTVGLVLAIADQAFRTMIEDHGVDYRALRFKIEPGTRDVDQAPVIVLVVEGDRPAGWTRPADHVGTEATEVP